MTMVQISGISMLLSQLSIALSELDVKNYQPSNIRDLPVTTYQGNDCGDTLVKDQN